MGFTGPVGSGFKAIPGIAPYPQMSIGCWIKLPASATTANGVFYVCMSPDNFSYQFNVHFAGTPTPNLFGSACQSQNGTSIDGTSATTVSNAGWHLICTTFDNQGTAGQVGVVKIYTDGALNNTVTAGGPVTALPNNDPGSEMIITPGNADGNALVDYPMVWKRLITPAEITALWNGGAGADPRTVAAPNLVSFVQVNAVNVTLTDLATPAIKWVNTATAATFAASPFPLSSVPTVKGTDCLVMSAMDLATSRSPGAAPITLGTYQTMTPFEIIRAYGLTG